VSEKIVPYVAPVQVFIHNTINNQYEWEAIVSGHGETKYIYGDTRMETMLKVCQALEKQP
jgi:hypothetical protein